MPPLPTLPPTITPIAPTPTPNIPPGVCTGYPTSGSVNKRSGPGTNYTKVGSLDPGSYIVLIGKNPDGTWYVANDSGGFVWLAAQFLTLNGPCSGLGLFPTPPPPVTPPTITPIVIVTATVPPLPPTNTPIPTLPPLSPTTTVVNSVAVQPGGFAATRVNCPAGMVAVGGGIDVDQVLSMVVTSSGPVFAQNNNRLIFQPDGQKPLPTGWQASARNNDASNKNIKVAVICV